MARRVIIERGGNAREIDAKLKNKWSWTWLEKEVNGVALFNFMKKLNKPGVALCDWCDCEVTYSGKGLSSLVQHVETSKHKTAASTRKTNYALPSTYRDAASTKERSNKETPYGLHPSFKKLFQTQPTMPTIKPIVPVSDRTANSEAKVLAFIAEKGLPFNLAGDLVALVKNLSKDHQALNSMSLGSASAAYKLKFGLAKTLEDNVVESLRKNFFSMNIDEATSKAYSRVLGVLVSFFNPSVGEVVTHHLASIELMSVTSLTLYQALEDLFTAKNIPWSNVMSILMDSCNVMRGSKSGLETRIRTTLAPHLLDVDGDSCHHAHNASRRLCAPFQGVLERLFSDIFTDFKWSSDQREYLGEICSILKIKFNKPARNVPHRWLSMFDVAESFHRMMKSYIVFYSLFVCDCKEVRTVLEFYNLKDMLDHPAVKRISGCLKRKTQTKERKARKSRITETIFKDNQYLRLVLSFYREVLPLLKSYVCLFESDQPLIHLLYEKQQELFVKLLTYFVTPESLSEAREKGLKKVNIGGLKLLKRAQMFVGDEAKEIVDTFPKNHSVTAFLEHVEIVYVACASSIQQKMPMDSKLLRSLAFLDPRTMHTKSSLLNLGRLPQLATNVLSKGEMSDYDIECRSLQQATLPAFKEGERIDVWWASLALTGNFPPLQISNGSPDMLSWTSD